VWSVGLISVYTPASLGVQMLYAFMVGGVTAGAIGVHAGHLPTYFALTSALLPVAVRFFVHQDWIHHVMAICVLIYFTGMAILAVTSNRATRESTRLRFRLASANDALARRANEQEQFAERLRRTEERLRLAVHAGRLGVWHWDRPLDKLEVLADPWTGGDD